MNQVSDQELKKVMADFLEMGHVENIAAMYRQDETYFDWTGEILDDERFSVRLGISVLFEMLQAEMPEKTVLAIPSLVRLLQSDQIHIRGEAISVLAIIGSPQAVDIIAEQKDDPSPQIKALVQEILTENGR